MNLQDYRKEIDRIDRELVALFVRRMEVSAGIAAYKQAHGLPVLDAAREQAKLQQVAELAPEQLRPDTAELYRTLFALSRGYQQRLQEEAK
jgi:chorismate mutase/prephenate dehydratase